MKMFLLRVVVSVLLFYVVNGYEYLNKPEGSTCQWMNATGVCKDARQCASFEFDVKNRKEPPICSYKGTETITCCTDCSFIDLENRILDQLDTPRYKTDRKYKKKCYEYQYLLPYKCKTHATYDYERLWNETRKCYNIILTANAPVGSEDAVRGDFPHMALLGYGPDLDSAQWLCGGSLISDRFILTAGHCASSAQLGEVKYVALGMLKRTDPPQYWKRYKVKRFIPHPDYHPPIKYNDIALIETETRVNLTEGVYPACLTHKPEFRDDNEAFATGWGSLGPDKENADILQKNTNACCFREILTSCPDTCGVVTSPCDILEYIPTYISTLCDCGLPSCYKDTKNICHKPEPKPSPVCSCLKAVKDCPCDDIKYVYFPEVEYPCTVVEMKPFYYSSSS